MEMFVGLLCIALTMIITYQVIGFWLLGLVVGSFLDRKKMKANLVSFLIASVLVIGIPLGVIQSLYPETKVPPSEILKEVREWTR